MRARLIALTDEARRALDGRERLLGHFPFRVGRESRVLSAAPWTRGERRLKTAPELNELYLVDELEPFHVSREHFQIEADGDRFFLADRGSACGTLVEGLPVGGDRREDRVELHDHDVIIVGLATSPFVFKFRLA
jgi:pSer/pThr/pTyr-binding forkhead associated (FHA) protein